jgi:hypothetical protein
MDHGVHHQLDLLVTQDHQITLQDLQVCQVIHLDRRDRQDIPLAHQAHQVLLALDQLITAHLINLPLDQIKACSPIMGCTYLKEDLIQVVKDLIQVVKDLIQVVKDLLYL